ncbi:MAG: hypothetical protein ACRED4_07360 [Brevundimonas sp.]
MTSTFSHLSTTALAGAILVLCGCGPSGADQDKSYKAGAGAASAESSAGGSARPAASGSITQNFGVTNPDLAASLPAFVQLPDGSRVQMHMPFSTDRRKGGTLMALTSMPQAAVIAFHRQLMASHGLVAQPDAIGPKGETILVARSADGTSEYNVSVFPPRNGDDTLFSVNYFEPNT